MFHVLSRLVYSQGLILALNLYFYVILELAEIEGTVNVESGLEWKDNLLNKSSSYFKITSSKIANEVQYYYYNFPEHHVNLLRQKLLILS